LLQSIIMLNSYFRGDAQHDAHELLRCVLDNLHEGQALRVQYDYQDVAEDGARSEEAVAVTNTEDKREALEDHASTASSPTKPTPPPYIQPASMISEIFQGQMVSQITCQECGNVSTTQEPFYDISLELPKEKQMKKVEQERGHSARNSGGWFGGMLNIVGIAPTPLSLQTCLHSFCTSDGTHIVARLPPFCGHLTRLAV
jgi:ubiquitin C-terminal hydrolase